MVLVVIAMWNIDGLGMIASWRFEELVVNTTRNFDEMVGIAAWRTGELAR